MTAHVEIYGTSFCRHCLAARELLDSKKIDYTEYLSVAIEAYQTTRFRTQVMLWPDKEGKFPTENEYSILVQRHALKVISASEDFDISTLEKDKHLH